MLDEVQNLPQLEAFDAARYLESVSRIGPADTLAALAGQLDGLRTLLDAVDRFAQKAMGIRLNQLATDPIPQPFRTLLKTTVIAYHGQTDLLRGRVATALGRIDRAHAAEVTERVMDAAERVLSLHAVLRGGILELAARVAAVRLPEAQKRGRDREVNDRSEWRRAEVDLRQLAARPELLAAASTADRMKRIPAPEEEAETESTEEKRFSLLEID